MSTIENHTTIWARLEYWANKQPDADALVYIDKDGMRSVLTRREIFDQSVTFAKQLRGIGVQPGNIICSLLQDSLNGMIAFFGIIFAGCVVQMGRPQLSDGSDLIQNLKKTKCTALIISSDENDLCQRIVSEHVKFRGEHYVTSETVPDLRYVVFTLDKPDIGFKWITTSSDDNLKANDGINNHDGKSDAMILLTSGTTGMSKMIVRSQSSILPIKSVTEAMYYISKSGIFSFHPFNYYLATGQKRVFIDMRNPPSSESMYTFVYDVIVREGCDFTAMSGAHYIRLVDILRSRQNSDNWPVKGCSIAGFPASKSIIDKMRPYFKTIFNTYASTEAGLVSFKRIDSDTEYEDFNVGRPIIGSDVIIKDFNGRQLDAGETGIIFVKTRSMFKRYFEDGDLHNIVFDDNGFYNMEDLGYLKENGEIISFGRTCEAIMRGEHYFHPSWIEAVIRSCPDVDDVIVVKVPDQILLNEICACVVLDSGSELDQDMLGEICKTKFIARNTIQKSACPKYFIILDKIPLNQGGKPDREAVEKYVTEYLV